MLFSPEPKSFTNYIEIKMFQSPKTGLCFSHFVDINAESGSYNCFNPLKRVYAFLTRLVGYKVPENEIMFQSPKTGLCFSHDKEQTEAEVEQTVSIP